MKRLTLASALAVLSLTIRPTIALATERTIESDRIGCQDRDVLSKLTRYAVDKDQEAFKTAAMAAVLSGQCIVFKKGETVFLMDTAIFSGLVQLRRKGETVEYWTNFEAISKQ